MKIIYGYLLNGNFYEVGTERGAKVAATRAGSTDVGYRSGISNMFVRWSVKRKGKWN